MKSNELFNTIPELATRLLFVIKDFPHLQEDKIIYLDYITLYANDFVDGLPSINTKSSQYSTELISYYPKYREALKYLLFKGLLDIKIRGNGLSYFPNKHVTDYLALFEGDYISLYKKNLQQIIQIYGNYTGKQLYKLISKEA